jgi:NADH:ubiquinone oxidoreductase subunit 5 (subunit L)/multisubunit Na+/H+ antiporter MnhA subunit
MNKAMRAPWGLWLLAVALTIPVLVFGFYFLYGSFEQFPTEEQQGKVRIVSALGFAVFALLEAIVIALLLRHRKSTKSWGAGAAQPSVPVERPDADTH